MEIHNIERGATPQYFSDIAEDVISSYAGAAVKRGGKISNSTIIAIKINKKELMNYISYAGSFTNVSKVKGGAYAVPANVVIDAIKKRNMAVVHIKP